MAAPIQSTGQTINAGVTVSLFRTRIVRGGTAIAQRTEYAVAPDGQRFLINITADKSTPSPIIIVTNWARALKK
jgi:hypothetical protein